MASFMDMINGYGAPGPNGSVTKESMAGFDWNQAFAAHAADNAQKMNTLANTPSKNLKELQQARNTRMLPGVLGDWNAFGNETRDQFWAQPGMMDAFNMQRKEVGGALAQDPRFSGMMNQMYQGAMGDPSQSVVLRQAQAQRQAAMGDIAKQSAMGARGGMSPAMQRAAMMQQSQVGANMAAQVAAARAQERQNQMAQFLQARAAERDARMNIANQNYGMQRDTGAGLFNMQQTARSNLLGGFDTSNQGQ